MTHLAQRSGEGGRGEGGRGAARDAPLLCCMSLPYATNERPKAVSEDVAHSGCRKNYLSIFFCPGADRVKCDGFEAPFFVDFVDAIY